MILFNRNSAMELLRKEDVQSMNIKAVNGTPIYTSPPDGLGTEAAIEQLNFILDSSEPNQFVIVEYSSIPKAKRRGPDSPGQSRNKSFKLRTGPEHSGAPVNGIGSVGNIGEIKTLMEENARLQNELNATNLRQEYDAKIRELNDKIESKGNFIETLLNSPLGQILAQKLVSVAAPAQPAPVVAVAGTDEPATDAQSTIVKAVNRLYRIDSNLPQTLTKLADMAEANPDGFRKVTGKIDMLKMLM